MQKLFNSIVDKGVKDNTYKFALTKFLLDYASNNKVSGEQKILYREIAEKFLKDGFTLAASDREIHPHEEAWLYSVASKNNIEKEWLSAEKKNILHNKKDIEHLEVDNLKVIY